MVLACETLWMTVSRPSLVISVVDVVVVIRLDSVNAIQLLRLLSNGQATCSVCQQRRRGVWRRAVQYCKVLARSRTISNQSYPPGCLQYHDASAAQSPTRRRQPRSATTDER